MSAPSSSPDPSPSPPDTAASDIPRSDLLRALDDVGLVDADRLRRRIDRLAARPDAAERIIGSLMSRFPGQQMQLDVPEPNEAGTRLAMKFGLKEVFGCARMYHGPAPDLPVERIFGVTSFEFG